MVVFSYECSPSCHTISENLVGEENHQSPLPSTIVHSVLMGIIKSSALANVRFIPKPNRCVPVEAPRLRSSISLGLGLLRDIVLSSTLLSLADIVLLLVIDLSGLVASDASNSAANRAGHAIADTTSQIGDLALSFLLLTLEVLLASRLLKTLCGIQVSNIVRNSIACSLQDTYLSSDEASNGFLGRADGLLVGTRGAVGVVLGDFTSGRSSSAGELGGSFGGIVLLISLVLLGLALNLYGAN